MRFPTTPRSTERTHPSDADHSLDDLTDLFDNIEARAAALPDDLIGVLERG